MAEEVEGMQEGGISPGRKLSFLPLAAGEEEEEGREGKRLGDCRKHLRK